MRYWPLDRNKGACLLGGIVAGVVATLIFQRAFGPDLSSPAAPPDPARLVAKPPAPVADPAEGTDSPPRSPGDSKAANLRGATDWKRVATQYAAPGSDSSLARSLMLRLDTNALRKLAENVATWPRNRRNLRILSQIFHRWGELDPQAAVAQAQTLPANLAFSLSREAVDGYAESDPAGASAFLAAQPTTGADSFRRYDWDRFVRLGKALESWSEQDAAAAAAFVGQLPREKYRSWALNGIAEEWMRQDPAAALRWAQSLGPRDQRTNALTGIVATWAETDPGAAANFVLGQSADPAQNDFVRSLATAWATQDQQAAARWAAGQSGQTQTTAATAVAESWVASDPLNAAVWSSELPDGDSRNEALAAVARSWYISDPAAAQSWLNSLPTGDGRDAAIVGATEFWNLRNQPTEILGLVSGVGDTQVRNDTTVKVLNEWLERDAPAARQWINQASLPEPVVAKLSKAATQDGG